jgi:Zn-dependent protease
MLVWFDRLTTGDFKILCSRSPRLPAIVTLATAESLSKGTSTLTVGFFMINNTILKSLSEIALMFPIFIIIFTFRGFFQSLAAKLVGDDTAEQDGFLTLNPLAHINIMGLSILLGVLIIIGGLFSGIIPRGILLLILILFGIRLTFPVPVDERNFKHYRIGGIATSLAGFTSSIILSLFSIILMKSIFCLSLPSYVVVTSLEICNGLIDLAILFGIIDLIPLPPFDGGRLLKYMLPTSQQYIISWLEEYSLFIVLFIFFVPGISDIFWGGLSTLSAIIKHLLFSLFF